MSDRMPMRAFARGLLLLSLALLVLSCSREDDSPEAQIRRFVAAGIEAAESRDSSALQDMLHIAYRDDRGYDRKQLAGLLRVYFLRHKNIHLFSKIDRIELINDSQARVNLHVAMAGSVIADVDALASLRAQIYRFELDLIRQPEWQLQHARWAPASAADLR